MKVLLRIVLALSLISPAVGQAQKAAPEQERKVRLGTTEVMLDVVVRDKKGRPVKDLSASDFEVYEDGVKQQIESFRLVLREGAAPVSEPKKGEEPKKE